MGSAMASMNKVRASCRPSAEHRRHGAGADARDLETELYVAPASAEIFIPEDKRLTLLQLNEHTCKWPIGDPLTKDFYFCGQHQPGFDPLLRVPLAQGLSPDRQEAALRASRTDNEGAAGALFV